MDNRAMRAGLDEKKAQLAEQFRQEVSAPPPAEEPKQADPTDDAGRKQRASEEIERRKKEERRVRKERLAADRKAKDLEAREKALAEREALLQRAKDDPFGFMQGLGVDLSKHIPDYLEGKVKPPPQKDPVQERLDQLAKENEDLRSWRKQQERLAQERLQRDSIQSIRAGIAEAIKDQDTFELVHAEGGVDRVYAEMMDGYAEAQRMVKAGEIDQEEFQQIVETRLKPDVVAKHLEEHFTEEMRKKAQSKRFKALFQPKGEGAPAPLTRAPEPLPPAFDPAVTDELFAQRRAEKVAALQKKQAITRRGPVVHVEAEPPAEHSRSGQPNLSAAKEARKQAFLRGGR